MTIHVGVALSARRWRGDLQRHCRDHVADVVVSLLHQGRDAMEGDMRVVIVDDDTSWLSAPFVQQARESGISVIGIYDPLDSDGHGQRHLQRLGVDCSAPASAAVDVLVDLVRRHQLDAETASRFETLTSDLSNRRPLADRQILAVGGPAGSGATEVSLAFANVLARRRGRPVLVDVDESHPTMARRLGLGLHPHLLSAVDAVRREQSSVTSAAPGVDTAEAVRACLAVSALGGPSLPFDVIVGLASRNDWRLARADDVGELLAELAAHWPVVVVRLGPQLEDLSRFVGRYEVSRVAASRADRLLAVSDGTSTGLLRFVDWLVDALSLIGDSPVDVVINRAPSAPAAQAQLTRQLREIGGDRLGQIVSVGRDRRVERAAWDAELVASGSFTKTIERLEAAAT